MADTPIFKVEFHGAPEFEKFRAGVETYAKILDSTVNAWTKSVQTINQATTAVNALNRATAQTAQGQAQSQSQAQTPDNLGNLPKVLPQTKLLNDYVALLSKNSGSALKNFINIGVQMRLLARLGGAGGAGGFGLAALAGRGGPAGLAGVAIAFELVDVMRKFTEALRAAGMAYTQAAGAGVTFGATQAAKTLNATIPSPGAMVTGRGEARWTMGSAARNAMYNLYGQDWAAQINRKDETAATFDSLQRAVHMLQSKAKGVDQQMLIAKGLGFTDLLGEPNLRAALSGKIDLPEARKQAELVDKQNQEAAKAAKSAAELSQSLDTLKSVWMSNFLKNTEWMTAPLKWFVNTLTKAATDSNQIDFDAKPGRTQPFPDIRIPPMPELTAPRSDWSAPSPPRAAHGPQQTYMGAPSAALAQASGGGWVQWIRSWFTTESAATKAATRAAETRDTEITTLMGDLSRWFTSAEPRERALDESITELNSWLDKAGTGGVSPLIQQAGQAGATLAGFASSPLMREIAKGGGLPGSIHVGTQGPGGGDVTGGGWAAGKDNPLNLRNNNPGNIRDGAWAQSQPGYEGPGEHGFAKFKTPEAGFQASIALLRNYGQQGRTTLNSIVSKWAPASENDPTAYARSVGKRLGIDPNAQLNMSDPEVLSKIASEMSRVEGRAYVGAKTGLTSQTASGFVGGGGTSGGAGASGAWGGAPDILRARGSGALTAQQKAFFAARGATPEMLAGVRPEFADREMKLLAAGERATGHQAHVESMFRSIEKQRDIYLHPGKYGAPMAAPPGASPHNFGLAADITRDPALVAYMNAHAGEYGLEAVRGDPGHVQLSKARAVMRADRAAEERRMTPKKDPLALSNWQLQPRTNVNVHNKTGSDVFIAASTWAT